MAKNKFSRREFLKRGLSLTGGSVALGAVGTASGGTPNSIVQENQQTGTSQDQWDLAGAGQYSGFGLGKSGVTNFIEGFADNMSVNHGQTINFKINTDSKNYRIDIYRLGYYGNLGARKVTTIQIAAASLQPTPLINSSVGLVDAGNWSATASWNIPANAVSGVYLAHLVRQDSVAGENHIPFVVRDDGTKHDIVFQTSDTTWHAYNGWGGSNLYGGTVSTATATSDGRGYKVSYNRPFGTRDNVGTFAGPQDFLFGAEYSAIRWLEANGYDVCYISGVDTDRNGGELLNHKIFISTGHDEYWSGGQRANVEAARAAGVHLVFWSGNEVFWKTRWEPSTDVSATPYRTLVCYKETRANAKIDPSAQWTGSWRDPSFSPPYDGGRPENALTGTIFQVDAYRSDVMSIPDPMTKLRFWRNTNVAATPSGQTASLVQNLLGYEWDQSPDNGFRPAGLIHLSSTTLDVSPSYLLDYGKTDGPGIATHNLSLYRDQNSGALVFGAGTVYWAWGLDADHDLAPTSVDANVQQSTVNLFADMGVQPQTLQSGLVAATKSTDITPPVSTITAPVAGASFVEGQSFNITGSAADSDGSVAGVEVSTDGGATWHPANGTTNWSYTWWARTPGTWVIQSRAADDSLNLEKPSAGISVTVTPAATVSLFTPGDLPATGGFEPDAVELGVKFQTSAAGTVTGFRFYKHPSNTGTHVGNLWSATGTLLATATFTNESASGWQQVNLSNPVTLTTGTTYIVSYHTNGNYSADSNYFAAAHTSGPLTALASSTSGGNGLFAYGTSSRFPTQSYVSANYWVDVVFNRAGGAGNLPPVANNVGGFVVTTNSPLSIPASALLANDSDPNGYPLSITSVSNPTNGTVTYDPNTQTVTFVPTPGYPSPNYIGQASFNYSISNGQGGTASALVTLTVSVPTSSLFSSNQVPTNVTINDPSPVELGMKFQTAAAGKVIGFRFYKGPQNTGTHVGNLWSAAGALLATVTFTNETASGWQQVNLANAVTLTAGASYVVSYHTNGNYSADGNYFTAALTSGPLTAPASSASGGNGVYAYGGSSAFPTNSYNSSNYWVDVVFMGAGGAGNAPPVANDDSGFVATENYALTIPASALLANDTDPNGYPLSITGVSNPTNGTVTYDSTTQTVTFVPASGYTGAAGFRYAITNGHGGSASANVALTVSPTASLFSANAVPSTVTVNDANPVELGVKFQAATAGTITGLRFYKGPQNTGTHIGNLWSAAGALLASATFANETASGWQQVLLSNPVPITAGTTYVASYHTNGFYSGDGGYFANSLTNGPLTALASSASGGNGVFSYGSSSSFPTGSFNSGNYWVDVAFTPSA